MEEEKKNQVISEHSTSLDIVFRLNSLWRDANNHSRAGRYSDWDEDLECIWRELQRDLDDDDFENYNEKRKDFNEKLTDSGKFLDKPPAGWKSLNEDDKQKRHRQKNILREKDIFLKRLENKTGKGTKFRDFSEDDFE